MDDFTDFILSGDDELQILLDGQRVPYPPEQVLAQFGDEQGQALINEAQIYAQGEKALSDLRRKVNKNVGGPESREGTLSDVVQIMVVIGLATVSAAKEGQSGFVARLNERLAALAPQAEGQPSIHDMADQYLAGIASGDIRLTPVFKGLGGVMAELITRQNATYDTLAAFIAEQQAAATGGV